MEESTALINPKADNRIPLGMSSFGVKEQHQFGRNVRLAMACIEGSAEPDNTEAMPSDETAIRHRLRKLSQDITSHHADLLELLVRFDDLEGWKTSGSKHCAAWMNLEIGISLQLGWEYLRVGRKLRSLPTTRALFRAGRLSWSKIRMIASVADVDNEKILCHAALDASVSDVKRLCDRYRWNEDDKDGAENDRALRQWESRSLTWGEVSNGSTRIQLILPPEIAQAFLNSVEHSLNQLEDSEDTISQRRADAAMLMAETSLQAAGREIATADRYQVIVSVSASDLSGEKDGTEFPSKRPIVKGAGSIARETARRIACDCSLTTNTVCNGEPTDIGRRSRIWPVAMARAIKQRDEHCQFPGCSQSRNLQIHHITHWADGGSTCVTNGVSLCQTHHTIVHEGGYSIQRVDGSEERLQEQFTQQQHADDHSLFKLEAELRNDRESFNKVRTLLSTSHRFRVVDAQGRDIRNRNIYGTSKNKTCYSAVPFHSTRVECAESESGGYYFGKWGNSGVFNLDFSRIA